MLKAEGIEINSGKIKNFEKILFRFPRQGQYANDPKVLR
jgi:hypothetical protein